MKLKRKIQLFSSLFMLVLIFIINISIYFIFYKVNTDSELEELEFIASDIVSAINDNPEVDLRGLLEAYLPANGMIRVVLPNNTPMFEITRDSQYLTLPWSFSNSENRKIVTSEDAHDIAVIEKPIIWPAGTQAGTVVTIQLSNHLISLHETMRTLLYVLLILSFVALLPVIIASALLSKFLLKPIQNLIETMKENSKQGNWQQINVNHRSRDEIYEMEMTFNEMIQHLKDNYEKQEMFVSDASHELKTPIQIIKSYAQLLERRKDLDQEIFNESIQAIDSETDRINQLVEQLLALAKNKEISHMEEVNIVEMVYETVDTFHHAYNRDIQILSGVDHLLVHGNKDQLKQVIYILIDNALKYSEKRISVNIFQHSTDAFLQVKDEGQGITKEALSRIFDRFYRVDKARSRATGGSGLGLAIAKTIADNHGAELSVESESGKGTIFTLKMKAIVD